MRVAHVITRMILGGAQENTLFNCEDLIRCYGDEVLLVTGPPLGPEGSLLQRARDAGVPVALVPPLQRAIHPWRDTAAYRQIRRILRAFRPEVVHTHSAKGGFLGRAAAWSLGVPAIVHTVHGAPFHPYQGRAGRALFRACERWAAGRCHAMISVADAMTRLMVDAGVAPREMFTTIYSGMDVDALLSAGEHRQRVRAELGYAADDVVVGKIARLFRLKGHADVIRAARQVVREVPRARFLFVGDGLLQADLRREIAAAGLTEHFQFTGLVPPERIPDLLSAMDIVVHASLREGLARVLPQALIAEKPVVSYDIDGAREVVLTGETGYLLSPQDIDGLARALVVLGKGGGLRQRMGEAGRRRFADLFRHEWMTARIRALYGSVLASRAGGVSG